MTKGSFFSTVDGYFRNVFRGVVSVTGTCLTALPYLLSRGDFRKEVTEQYPDPVSARTADDLPARTRGLLYNDITKCTGCKSCAKVCPIKCITIQTELGADEAKVWVSVYDIDFAQCVFCGLCVEVCPPASLVHTKKYEGAVYSLPDLVKRFGQGTVTPEQREKWAQIRLAREAEEYHT